jgi:hypothetical protein
VYYIDYGEMMGVTLCTKNPDLNYEVVVPVDIQNMIVTREHYKTRVCVKCGKIDDRFDKTLKTDTRYIHTSLNKHFVKFKNMYLDEIEREKKADETKKMQQRANNIYDQMQDIKIYKNKGG